MDAVSAVRAGGRLARCLLALCVALLTLAGVMLPATAAQAAAPTVDVTCTSQVAYGGEIDCTAASVDANGNYGVAGTFTFDPAHVLPAGWSHPTCTVNASSCQVAGTVAVVPGASGRTVAYTVQFTAVNGSKVSTGQVVQLTLVPTITTLTCDASDLAFAGSTHCVVSVVDQLYDGAATTPARLPAHVSGLHVGSSGAGDLITYDHPSADGSTCVAAVVGQALQCGLTVQLDGAHGLHTLTAGYPGDPATDEAASSAAAPLSDGSRATPTVTVTCPASVPARQPQTTCQVSVAPAIAGGAPPTGTVTLDQSFGPPPPNAPRCTLSAGSCTLAYEVFEGTVQLPAPAVRATYGGDDNYLPASATTTVTVVPTPTTSSLTCAAAAVPVGGDVHCTFVLTGPDGRPVPVGPADSITITATSGTVVCDVPADYGCGHVDTDVATVAGFTVRAGSTAGLALVTGQYSGDPFNQVAGTSKAFVLTTVAPAAAVPPVIAVGKPATSTSVRCPTSAAYLHPVTCLVTVTSSGTVPTGVVRVSAPSGAHEAFAPRTCTLTGTGQCTVALTPVDPPGKHADVTADYLGATGFQPSAGQTALLVRAVATTVDLRCAHASVTARSAVHCTATVRTEFGGVPAAPARTAAEVTVTSRGDRITYDHGTACHWTVTGHALSCGFTVRVVSGTTVHVYYRGSIKAHDATSKGAAAIRTSKARA